MKQVKMVTKECVEFASCVAKVLNMRRNGLNDVDCISLATALYNKRMLSSLNEDCGPKFNFIGEWIELKDHPKFDHIKEALHESFMLVV